MRRRYCRPYSFSKDETENLQSRSVLYNDLHTEQRRLQNIFIAKLEIFQEQHEYLQEHANELAKIYGDGKVKTSLESAMNWVQERYALLIASIHTE